MSLLILKLVSGCIKFDNGGYENSSIKLFFFSLCPSCHLVFWEMSKFLFCFIFSLCLSKKIEDSRHFYPAYFSCQWMLDKMFLARYAIVFRRDSHITSQQLNECFKNQVTFQEKYLNLLYTNVCNTLVATVIIWPL